MATSRAARNQVRRRPRPRLLAAAVLFAALANAGMGYTGLGNTALASTTSASTTSASTRPAGAAFVGRAGAAVPGGANGLTGSNVLGWGIQDPYAEAVLGDDVFVAEGDALVEVNLSTGALVRIVAGKPYDFGLSAPGQPGNVIVAGQDILVANQYEESISEVDARTGALVRVISGPSYQLGAPAVMAAYGSDLFVANAATTSGNATNPGSVVEIDLATGLVVRSLAASRYQFHDPDALVLDGDHLFVASADDAASQPGLGAGAVTELDARTGALVRVIAGPAYHFFGSDALALDGGRLLVANANTSDAAGSVTEVDPATGALVGLVQPWPKGYSGTTSSALATAGQALFVGGSVATPGGGTECNAIAELNPAHGSRWHVFSGPGYDFGASCEMAPQAQGLVVAAAADVLLVSPGSGDVRSVASGSSYDFAEPCALAVSGNDLFVANLAGNSVTEVDAVTGRPVRLLVGARYRFNQPDALAVAGPYLIVASGAGGNYTELPTGPSAGQGDVTEVDAATGAVVRVLSGSRYGFDELDPQALAVQGDDVFIAEADDGNGQVLEVDVRTGAVVKSLGDFAGPDEALAVDGDDLFASVFTYGEQPPGTFSASLYRVRTTTGAVARIYGPSATDFPALAIAGADLYAAWGNSVLQLNPVTGRSKALTAAAYGWDGPISFATGGGRLFVANSGDDITEVDADSGQAMAVLACPRYGFSFPAAVAIAAGRVFVANATDSSVTEFAMPSGPS